MKGSIFHKMQTSTCWIVCLVLLGVYLFAALRPGVWLRDAFLYRQADGSFSGKDAYAAYTLQLSGTESEARGSVHAGRRDEALPHRGEGQRQR